MKIVLGICGGIAAYKSASLTSLLAKENIVKVVMTNHATKFITPLTFQTLSKQEVIVDMFDENEPEFVRHIHYAQDYDVMIIAPTTANLIGKVANGIADDMLSSMILASTIPILFVPTMNTYMYENRIVQENIQKLKEYGYYFVKPDSGMLACGIEGKGKYPKLDKILNKLNEIL